MAERDNTLPPGDFRWHDAKPYVKLAAKAAYGLARKTVAGELREPKPVRVKYEDMGIHWESVTLPSGHTSFRLVRGRRNFCFYE